MAQCVRSLDLTTHASLSPIRRGFAPGFVNYKKGCTRIAAASDNVYQLLAHGRWFSHDIAEILLKVALKHQQSFKIKSFSGCQNIDTIASVMVSMIASDAVDFDFEPLVGSNQRQEKLYLLNSGECKDWLARNQDNVSE